MHEDIAEILYTERQIAERIGQIGAAITAEHDDAQGVVVVSVLKGAAIFMADLVRCIHVPVEMDFMALSSYGNAAESSGVVKVLKGLSANIEGRHVIVAEDILDSGVTLKFLLDYLAERGAASIQVVALLRKRNPRQQHIECKYVGFECPDEFIVGYGLDYAERYRNLPYIGVLKPEIYQ